MSKTEFEFEPSQIEGMAKELFDQAYPGILWERQSEQVQDLYRKRAEKHLRRVLPYILPLRPEEDRDQGLWEDYKQPWTFYKDGDDQPFIGAGAPYPTRDQGEWRWGYRKVTHGQVGYMDIARNRDGVLAEALEEAMAEVGMFDPDDSTGLYLAGDSWDTYKKNFANALSKRLLEHNPWKDES